MCEREKDRDPLHFAELTSRGRQGLDAAMFLHAFEPLPRWRSPLLRTVAPLYRNEKKKRIDTKTNWRTAHCTLTTPPRRSTYTINQPPFFETPARGAGKWGRGGNGEGKITPTQHLLHPFLFFLSLRFFFFARIISLFHDT